jgi:hypothetical protein
MRPACASGGLGERSHDQPAANQYGVGSTSSGGRERMRGLPATTATIVMALVAAAPAMADPGPAPPTEPIPAPTAPAAPTAPPEFIPQKTGIGNPLAQSGSQSAGVLGLPDLSAYGPNLLLGQNTAPAAPGDPAAAVVPNLNAFNPQYLLGQNAEPAAPGEGSAAPGLAPDQDSPGTGRIAFLRRLYEMYQAGGLRGSLLGQQSPEEFAQQDAGPATPSPSS